MAGCHKNSISIIFRYLYDVSQFHEKIDTCKLCCQFSYVVCLIPL